MRHGGEIYDKEIEQDFSVSLNPYPCPDEVKKALMGAVCDMVRYPDIEQSAFREAVARAENALSATYESKDGLHKRFSSGNVIGGNGASELIMAIVSMVKPRKVLLPVPSFYGYVHCLNMLDGCEVVNYELSEEEGFELEETFVNSITRDIDMVILGNPNNPTGKTIKKEVLEAVIQKCRLTDSVLVADECFLRLSEKSPVSAREYIDIHNRLYVIDAYTKLFSIPGVRVGFCITQEANRAELKNFLPEWNLSVFAGAAGVTCANIIADGIDIKGDGFRCSDSGEYIKKSLDMISAQREYLTLGLKRLGIKVFDSDTNYFMIKVTGDIISGADREHGIGLYGKLLAKHILIRDCSTFDGLSEGYYRIAVKDHESNNRLLLAISEIMR